MAEIRKIGVTIETSVELIINESELKALDALFCYGIDNFLKIFYSQMGRSYLEPHEKGIRSLAATVSSCAGLAGEAKECREFLRQTAEKRVGRIR